jgi:hypothetical protein
MYSNDAVGQAGVFPPFLFNFVAYVCENISNRIIL